MGDFNIDLLKIEIDEIINEFYNILNSNLFVPHITLPTRITTHSKTLIDNIFSNDPNFSQGVSGNFTFSISDHLPQFLLMPMEDNLPPKKHNIYYRSKTYDKEDIVADFLNINWQEVLQVEKMDTNYSLEMFENKMKEIFDKHVPLKKKTKKDFKLQAKPWITTGIINSIKRRDKLLRSYITYLPYRSMFNEHRETISFHTLRSSILFLSSSVFLIPVSSFSMSIYVFSGRPFFLDPWVGSHSSSCDTGSSSFLAQCPADLNLLLLIVADIFGKSPYSSLFVMCCFQLMFSAFRIIRV